MIQKAVFMINYSRLSIIILSTINILLGDFNSKVGRENIFKLKIGNESLH